MSALDPDKQAIVRELLNRRDSLPPEKQSIVDELGRRFSISATTTPYAPRGPAKGPAIPPPPAVQEMRQPNAQYEADPFLQAHLSGVSPSTLIERASGITNTMLPAGSTPRPDVPPLTPEQEIGAKVAGVSGMVETGRALGAWGVSKLPATVPQDLMASAKKLRSEAALAKTPKQTQRATSLIRAAERREQAARMINPDVDLYTNPQYQNRPPTTPVPGKPFFWEQEKVPGPTAPPGVSSENQRFLDQLRGQTAEQAGIQQKMERAWAERGSVGTGKRYFWEKEPPSATIPKPQPPTHVEAPQPSAPIDQDALIAKGISPSGNRAKETTLRLTDAAKAKGSPLLRDVAPEVAGKAPGPEFDKALIGAYKRTLSDVAAAQDAVPTGVTVPKGPIVDRFLELEGDYHERGLLRIEAQIKKLREKWDDLPADIPYDIFRKMKRAFFDEGGLGKGPQMRAYYRLMESESQVSPGLQQANRAYSTVRRAMEAGNMDLATGRRIAQVGKTVPDQPVTTRRVPINQPPEAPTPPPGKPPGPNKPAGSAPSSVGSPKGLHEKISAKDVLHHSTDLESGINILKEGAIRPGGRTSYGGAYSPRSIKPTVAAEGVGFTKPTTSFSRAQRVVDPITFEVEPTALQNKRPVQGLTGFGKRGESLKAEGKFEFETATDQPTPISKVKNILINTDRAIEMYGEHDAAQMIAQAKELAAQRGIPVVEGAKTELLKRRVLGQQDKRIPPPEKPSGIQF